jgi:predicted AAA+ superfamily ATPase
MKRKITRQFITWKKNNAQKPLLVYGAGQVGKSYAVIDFGQSNYDQKVKNFYRRYCNIGINENKLQKFFSYKNFERISRILTARILTGSTGF